MDENYAKNIEGKSPRPVRNRRYSRKTFGNGQKAVKRLFTPEIKRFLKEWLVRRRENPYPNREEKKLLAVETGLTYIQICNWFANWRRKLKNASNEHNKKTWGHLIKSYNNKAKGNIEQFSICSDDSIWGEPDPASSDTSAEHKNSDHCYTTHLKADASKTTMENTIVQIQHSPKILSQSKAQCYHVSSTTEEYKPEKIAFASANNGNKYKSHIMKKYMKGLELETVSDAVVSDVSRNNSPPRLLSRWLKSAVNFQPSQSNYTWTPNSESRNSKKCTPAKAQLQDFSTAQQIHQAECLPQNRNIQSNVPNYFEKAFEFGCKDMNSIVYDSCIHGREEVEAAVALTRLASLRRC